MPLWRFHFKGRKKGAIGITIEYVAEREADTCHHAHLALYDEYEHISVHKAELVPDKKKEQTK